MKNISLVLVVFAITACTSPAPVVTMTPQPTHTATATYTPTPTATATATLPAPEITLVTFDPEHTENIPLLNVEEFSERNGHVITPGDIIDLPDSEQPFLSDVKVIDLGLDKDGDGSRTISFDLDTKIDSVTKLPIRYSVLMLDKAKGIEPEVFDKLEKAWREQSGDTKLIVEKLLAIKATLNTVGGKLDWVMITSGDFVNGINGARDKSDAIDELAGEDFKFPAVPLIKFPDDKNNCDALRSILARKIYDQNVDAVRTVGELMASTDLTDPKQFKKLQEALWGEFLYLNIVPDLSYIKVNGKIIGK